MYYINTTLAWCLFWLAINPLTFWLYIKLPGCWLIFSTHVTALCGRESKSYIQVVMETTSKLLALTLELWQVESLSLKQTGGVWGSTSLPSLLWRKILWFEEGEFWMGLMQQPVGSVEHVPGCEGRASPFFNLPDRETIHRDK